MGRPIDFGTLVGMSGRSPETLAEMVGAEWVVDHRADLQGATVIRALRAISGLDRRQPPARIWRGLGRARRRRDRRRPPTGTRAPTGAGLRRAGRRCGTGEDTVA